MTVRGIIPTEGHSEVKLVSLLAVLYRAITLGVISGRDTLVDLLNWALTELKAASIPAVLRYCSCAGGLTYLAVSLKLIQRLS